MYLRKGSCVLTNSLPFWGDQIRLFLQNLQTEDYTCSKYNIDEVNLSIPV